MRSRALIRLIKIFLVVALSQTASGCGFLAGFGLFEQPTLYYLDVAEVATQVACELEEFVAQHQDDPLYTGTNPKVPYHRWVLADDDIAVKLTLQTDESGYVNFTGINVAQLGLASFQSFILATTSGKTTVPSLAAKASAKRTKSVVISFSVGAKSLASSPKVTVSDQGSDKVTTVPCAAWKKTKNAITSLYLKDWLNNYFETINGDHYPDAGYKDTPNTTSVTDTLLRDARTSGIILPVPNQFKIQSVELSTTILLAVDVSSGASPNVLGNGTVFILPVNGLSLDYNPDYSHKIDITLNVCDNSVQSDPLDSKRKLINPCHQKEVAFALTGQLVKQCQIYSWLEPILSGVKPPPDVDVDSDCVPSDLCSFYPNTCKSSSGKLATCASKRRTGVNTVALTCSKVTGEYVKPSPPPKGPVAMNATP
jgi:hypothetical protein